jgi:predicted RNase H-like HicB family nuclease
VRSLAIHDEVLRAARRFASRRKDWSFTPLEVVVALPHLNERSVRTHVVSRCCVNAPKHHPHRWRYFRRIQRGRYQILPEYRENAHRGAEGAAPPVGSPPHPAHVAEGAGRYTPTARREVPAVIHALVSLDRDTYVAECLEIAVVTQARTLDELITNLREAVGLHLEDLTPDPARRGESPRLSVIVEVPPGAHGRKA